MDRIPIGCISDIYVTENPHLHLPCFDPQKTPRGPFSLITTTPPQKWAVSKHGKWGFPVIVSTFIVNILEVPFHIFLYILYYILIDKANKRRSFTDSARFSRALVVVVVVVVVQ